MYITREKDGYNAGSYNLKFASTEEQLNELFTRTEIFKEEEIMIVTFGENYWMLYQTLNSILHHIREIENFEIKDKSRIKITIDEIFKKYPFPKKELLFFLDLFRWENKIFFTDEKTFTFSERETQTEETLQCPCDGILKNVGWGNMDLDTSHICLRCKTNYMYIDIPVIEALNLAYREKMMCGEGYSFEKYCKDVIDIIRRNETKDKQWKSKGKILSKGEMEDKLTETMHKQISPNGTKGRVMID